MYVGISLDKEVTCDFCAIRSLLLAFACCHVCPLGLSDLFFFFSVFFCLHSIPVAWRNPSNAALALEMKVQDQSAGGSPSNFCPSLLALHTDTQHFLLTAWFSRSLLLLQKQTLSCTASSLPSRVFSPFSPCCGVKAGGSPCCRCFWVFLLISGLAAGRRVPPA